MLHHVLDLALHGDEEEHEEVQQQNGPENRDVKHGEECRNHAIEEGFGS